VDRYRASGGDPGSDRLLAFLASYRAWVRAKVALIRADELDVDDPARERAVAEASELFALGERFAWRSRRPVLLAICGVAASGKTTLAVELAVRSGLPHISSDVVRKELAGVAAGGRAGSRFYSPEFSDRVYRELGGRAREAAEELGGAIVDATFHLERARRAFRSEVVDAAVEPLFVECEASAAVLVERARRRAGEQSDSDADEGIVARQLAAREPLDDIAEAARMELSTEAPLGAQVVAVEAFVDAQDAQAPNLRHTV
jgi:hypothetical protein